MPSFQRPARVGNDPDKYIRTVKGGRYQARPYDLGVRYNLGLFLTKHAARKAIELFWWGRLQPRLRFARPIRRRDDSVEWMAVLRLPHWLIRLATKFKKDVQEGPFPEAAAVLFERRGTWRIPGTFATAEEANAVAVAWIKEHIGGAVAHLIIVGATGSGVGEQERDRKEKRRENVNAAVAQMLGGGGPPPPPPGDPPDETDDFDDFDDGDEDEDEPHFGDHLDTDETA